MKSPVARNLASSGGLLGKVPAAPVDKTPGTSLYQKLGILLSGILGILLAGVPLAAVPPALAQTAADAAARPTYREAFEISSIDAYTNNGGMYQGSPLSNAFDGDLQTHWETGRRNTSTFKNDITVTFRQIEKLGKVSYYPRVVGAPLKGYPLELSIYTSQTDDGDDFTQIHHGTYSAASGELAIPFTQEQPAKRIRFVFDRAQTDWAAAGELKFYRPDPLPDKISALFADPLFTTLKANVTLEQVEQLYQESLTHPHAHLTEQLAEARAILNGETFDNTIFTLPRDGNIRTHTRDVLKMSSFGGILLPTGLAANQGQVVRVYVDANAGEPLPKIVFSQSQGKFSEWNRKIQLHPGENIITVPTILNPANVTAGGPIYFENPYTPAEQSQAPRVRIADAYRFPYFADGGDPQEFVKFLAEYKQKQAENPAAYASIAELASDWVIMTGTLANAEVFLTGKNPQTTLDFHKQRYQALMEYSGLSEFGPQYTDPQEWIHAPRQMVRAMSMPGGIFAYAMSDHSGFGVGTMNNYFNGESYGWAMTHELGHQIDLMGAKWPEVTNNMWANYNQVVLQGQNDRITADQYHTLFTQNALDDYAQNSKAISNLAIFWQLHLYDHDFWPKFQDAARDDELFPDLTTEQRLVALSSYILGFDLTEHFDRHNYFDYRWSDPAAQAANRTAAKNAIAAAGIPDRPDNMKTWYLWTKAAGEQKTFADLTAPRVSNVTYANGTATISLTDDLNREESRLGYEVFMDGKLVGFAYKDQITVPYVDDGASHTFTARAYDMKLNRTELSEPFDFNTAEPSIVLTSSTIIPVGSELSALDDIAKAMDRAGTPLAVSVDKTGVDLTQPGRQFVTISATDAHGVSVSRVVDVDVVASAAYISDLTPAAVQVGWGDLGVDSRIGGGAPISLPNGTGAEQIYPKGLVSHAPAVVEFDLAGMNPQYFEAFIGIDGAVRTGRGNAIMKVEADGKLLYQSGNIYAATPVQRVKLDITGVQQLKLIADPFGINAADHTAWADAKISEYPLASIWSPSAEALVKQSGDTVTQQDLIAQIRDGAPAAKVKSISVESPIPASGAADVSLRITYLDGTTDEVVVPVSFVRANLVDLAQAISAGEAELAATWISADGTEVPTAEKWVDEAAQAALNTVLAHAKTLLADETASQAKIDTMVATVNQALADFNLAKADGLWQPEDPQAPQEPTPAPGGTEQEPDPDDSGDVLDPNNPEIPEPPIATITPDEPKFVIPAAADPAACTVAPFVTVSDQEGVSYTVRVGGMELAPNSEGKYVYDYGQTVVVTAIPTAGYQFPADATSQWSWTANLPGTCQQPGDNTTPKPGEDITVEPGGDAAIKPPTVTPAPMTPVIPQSPVGAASALATTGAAVLGVATAGGLLLVAGLVILLIRRKMSRK
ncbi:MAG: NPCBM/NEW2 domain-containing protein [Trueperella sp.]|nr:NPCBM/NEW2 domain-containing protein [Trueperella sp.]